MEPTTEELKRERQALKLVLFGSRPTDPHLADYWARFFTVSAILRPRHVELYQLSDGRWRAEQGVFVCIETSALDAQNGVRDLNNRRSDRARQSDPRSP